MSHIGKTAPDFSLLNTNREAVSLSGLRGGKVVLAFFPAAFTGVCEKEVCAFQDALASFNDVGATVLGISVDGPFANAAFAAKNNINFTILSDYGRDFSGGETVFVRGVDGVRDVQIDRHAERVRVVASSSLSASMLEAAIEGAGSYEADLVRPGPKDSESR